MISFWRVGYEGKENMRLWTEEHTYKIFMNYVIITDFYNGDFMAFWQEIRRDTHLILKKRYFIYGWKW